MNRNWKHAFSLILSITLIFLMMTGCAANTSTNSDTTTTSAAGTGTSSTTTSNANMTPWGLDKSETYLIKVLTSGAGSKYWTKFSETEVGKVVLDKFNIDFEYIPYTESDVEKQNLLLASGEYNDICQMQGSTVRSSYMDADALASITPYLNKMTNFSKLFETQIPYYQASATNKEVYYWTGDGVPNNIVQAAGNGAMVRADALKLYGDKFGYDNPPTTDDDFLELMKLAKEADLKDINGKSCVGLTMPGGESWGLKGIVQGLAENSHYGKTSSRYMVYDVLSDKYVPFDQTDYYKHTCWFFNQLSQIGYLDEELFTMTGDQLNDVCKVASPIMVWYCGWYTGVNPFIVEAGHPEMQYVSMAMMSGVYKGKDIYTVKTPTSDFENWGISSKAKYPERIAELLDYLCSEDGLNLSYNGVEGVQWEKDADGNRVVIGDAYKKRTSGYPEYSEEYKDMTGIGYLASFIGPSCNVYMQDGEVLPITGTKKFIEDWTDKKTVQYEFMNKYGMLQSTDYLTSISKLFTQTMPPTVEFETGSTYAALADTLVDVRVQHLYDIFTAKDDAAFEAAWQAMQDDYAKYDVAGYVAEYNKIGKEIEAAAKG
ncbi:MAG: hypothetical protein VB070_06090 [Clostridiaceae bacterium]|nr:hypothetical protein [Clostridiaceae bacterium]